MGKSQLRRTLYLVPYPLALLAILAALHVKVRVPESDSACLHLHTLWYMS